jgi:hypothetical protein
MIVMCFNMQGEDSTNHTNGKCLHLSMQEEDILEHIDVKFHLCTLLVNL